MQNVRARVYFLRQFINTFQVNDNFWHAATTIYDNVEFLSCTRNTRNEAADLKLAN